MHERQATKAEEILGDGLVLRTARPDDLGQIGALLAARGEEADALDHALIMEDSEGGWESCAVAVDGDRVVATATLLDETLVLDTHPIKAGQIDLVATAREYEGRGLMRSLIRWAHDRSAARGHLVQVMVGIPYFYRQFGYEYAIPRPQTRAVTTLPVPAPGYNLRQADQRDIPAMAALQKHIQQEYDVSMPHSQACWRWLLARATSNQLVIEQAGSVVATCRATPGKDSVVASEIAAVDLAAGHALVGLIGADNLKVQERLGSSVGDWIEGLLEPRSRDASAYYVRVPDVPALLDHLRPVMSRRLRAGAGYPMSGEVLVSFFRHHVRMTYEDGRIVDVRPGGAMQSPFEAGGAGVAPDLVAHLLFGAHGAAGLAERHADVQLGPKESLMRTLFPPVRADIMTFYLA